MLLENDFTGRERERYIYIKRLIPIRGEDLIKGIPGGISKCIHSKMEIWKWKVEISFIFSTYTFPTEVESHAKQSILKQSFGSSLTSMVIYIANTGNFPTGKLLIQMLWNVATSFACASIARNRRGSGNSCHPANKILSPNSKRNFPGIVTLMLASFKIYLSAEIQVARHVWKVFGTMAVIEQTKLNEYSHCRPS